MKFKKHISLLLAFFLLVSNTGLAFNVHYCGDKVASVEPVYLHSDINPDQKGCCGEKVEKQDSCCRSITLQFQEKSVNNLAKSFSFKAGLLFIKEDNSLFVIPSIGDTAETSVPSYHYEVNSPPFFKLYHQYIFYE